MNTFYITLYSTLFFLLSAYLMYAPLSDHDIWHHMLIAKDFLETGHLSTVDKFTVIGEGRSYQPYAWLGGMIFYAAYSLFGDYGIVGFRLLFLLGCTALVLYLCRKRNAPLWLCYIMVAAASLLLAYRLERPDIFSAFFLLLLVDQLYFSTEWSFKKKCIAGSAAMILWINLHPFCLLMIPIGFLYAIGCVAEYLTSNEKVEKDQWLKHSKESIILFCCLVIGSLCHPYPVKNYIYSFLQRSDFTPYANEWRAFNPFTVTWQIDGIYLLFLVLLFFYLIMGIFSKENRVTIPTLAVIAFVTWMSISSMRFMWMWIVVFPLLAGWLINYRFIRSSHRILYVGMHIIPVLLLVVFTFDQYRFHRHEFQQPSYAIKFLQDAGIEGKVFLTHMWGGELAFKMYPQCKPLCDIRLDLYSPDLLDVVVHQIQRDPVTVYSIINETNIQIAMVPNKAFQTNLFEYEKEWIRVFDNGNATVYLKVTPENQTNLQKVESFYQRYSMTAFQDQRLNIASIFHTHPDFFQRYSWLSENDRNALRETSKSAWNAKIDGEANEDKETAIHAFIDKMIEHGFFYETIIFLKELQSTQQLQPELINKMAYCYQRIGDTIKANNLMTSPITTIPNEPQRG